MLYDPPRRMKTRYTVTVEITHNVDDDPLALLADRIEHDVEDFYGDNYDVDLLAADVVDDPPEYLPLYRDDE